MHDAWSDQRLDSLLREALGGEKPPDLVARTMARQRARRARRVARTRRRGIFVVAAVAALIAVVAPTALRWQPERKPFRVLDGDVTITVDGGAVATLKRGATVTTGNHKARLALGDTVQVAMSPKTQMRLPEVASADRQKVFLSWGELTLDVAEPGKELFSVVTDHGRVTNGTKFIVRVEEEKDPMNKKQRSMFVKVLAGAVLITTITGAQTELLAGEGGRRFNGRRGQPPTVRELTKSASAADQEMAGMLMHRENLTNRLKVIEAEIDKHPDVVVLLDQALAASQVYAQKLSEDPKYTEIQLELKEAQTTLKTQKANPPRQRGEWREYRKSMWGNMKAVRETKTRLAAVANTDPGIIDLRKKKEAAWAAYVGEVKRKREANQEYTALTAKLKTLKKWLAITTNDREFKSRQARENQEAAEQKPAGKRRGKKKDPNEKAAPEKPAEVF